MADVFISYSREDKPFIEKIVSAFEAFGISAWFDVRLKSGDSFDEVIAAEIERVKAVLVCWSTTSVSSKWVKTEASFGEDQNILAACFIESCEPPFLFRLVNAVDLCGWNGELDHAGWLKILERIGPLIGRPGLLSLALAMSQKAPENARAQWARQYPDDPMAQPTWMSWLDREQARFAAELETARKSLEDHFNRRKANAKAKLTSLEKEFERWRALAKPGDLRATPDPKSVAASLMSKLPDDKAASNEPLSSALARAEMVEAEAAQLREENAGLSSSLKESAGTIADLHGASDRATAEINELRARAGDDARRISELQKERKPPPSGPLIALTLALGIGCGGLGAYFSLQPQKGGSPDIVALRGELEKSRSQVDQLKSSLGKVETEKSGVNEKLVKATQDLATATEAARRAGERAAADTRDQQISQLMASTEDLRTQLKSSRDEVDRLKGDKPTDASSGQQTSRPAQNLPSPSAATARSTKVCTQLAGGVYDGDNTSGDGQKSIDPNNQAVVLSAISACKTAADSSADRKMKRQMLAQLGRSYAAYAVNLKVQNDDTAGAKENMTTAIGYLEQSRKLGSAYATSLLAAYRDGKLGDEAGKGFFIARRQSDEAAPLYLEAAQAGNPTAMTNYAAAVLDRESGLQFDEQIAVQWLKKAEAVRYPQAFLIHAGAMLDERVSPGLSVEDRRRAAARLADQASCIDREAADRFYQRNRRLAPYRTNSPNC